jgi:hypothetical protein
MNDEVWQPLLRELDRWSADGRQVRIWLRDDDAVAPNPALDRLARTAARFGAPVLLAVIPMLAEPALAATIKATPWLLPCQHGCRHRNHAPEGAKKSEFGSGRSAGIVRGEIAEARQRLGDLLGPALLPVFVPPWNRIDPGHAALLPELGLTGLSCFRNFSHGLDDGPILANTHIDIMDWDGGRIGRSPRSLVPEICGLLAERRLAPGPADDTIGLLLHHRDHDDAAWAFLDTFGELTAAHDAVIPMDPRRLFSPVPAA